MGHFTTLRNIKVDVRVYFDYNLQTEKIDAKTFFCAVGKFMEKWARYLEGWKIVPDANEYDEPVVRFSAEMEDIPALLFDRECTDFIRSAENWVADPSAFDRWYFNENITLGNELACFFFDEMAKYCGFENPAMVGSEQMGFEVECSGVYVSEMVGYVPTEATPISDYNENEEDTP